MKKLLTLLFSVFLIGSILGQEERILSAFSGVDAATGVYVTLIKGDSPMAEVEMIKGDSENLIIENRGSVLHIKFKSKNGLNWGGNNHKANVTIYYQELDMLEASSGAKIYGDEYINANDFEIDASSGSSIKVMVNATDMDIDVSSGASVKLDGSANSLEIDVSSGASYKGETFETKAVDASASSGASARVWVTDSLKASASSGGSVKYKGEPEKTNLDSSKYSGGSIKKM